jgi:hypothetical protein
MYHIYIYVMYEDEDVQILSILYTDPLWMNREKENIPINS